MTKTSHELLKQEKKENKVIEYVKKGGKNSILRYYVLKSNNKPFPKNNTYTLL